MSGEIPIRYRVSKKDKKSEIIPKTRIERRISKHDRLALARAAESDDPKAHAELLKRIKISR